MKNQAAIDKSKEVKTAAKKVAAKFPPYKHASGRADPVSTQDVIDPPDQAASAFGSFAQSQLTGSGSGVHSTPSDVVHSGFSSPNLESNMNDTTTPTDAEVMAKAKAEQKAKDDAAKAEQKAKKEKEAADKKAAAEADKKAKFDARAKAQAEATQKREQEAIARKEAAAAKAEEAKAAGKTVRERTYEGSMLVLADRVKQGVYTKGLNGQLRSNDPVAVVLESVPANKMVELLMKVFQEKTNKYAGLNYGQQSMNYRNRLRGAIKKELEVNGVKITLDHVKQIRDDGGYATVEADLAAKADQRAKLKADADAAAKAKAAEAVSKATTPNPGNTDAEAAAPAA